MTLFDQDAFTAADPRDWQPRPPRNLAHSDIAAVIVIAGSLLAWAGLAGIGAWTVWGWMR